MVGEMTDRRMRRLDSDGDGKISRQEIAPGSGGRFAEHLSTEFDRADRDRDHFISREELSQAMMDASICGLGQAAPNPALTVMKYFPQEVG